MIYWYAGFNCPQLLITRNIKNAPSCWYITSRTQRPLQEHNFQKRKFILETGNLNTCFLIEIEIEIGEQRGHLMTEF
jgi:hypothetical protein